MAYNRTPIMPQKIILNDILDKFDGKNIIDIVPQKVNNITLNEDLLQTMYDVVVNSYAWSEIAFETAEQFLFWFQGYWNRNIYKNYFDLYNQIMFGNNLSNARIETNSGGTETSETPNLTETKREELGETNTTHYGKTLNHERELTEDFTPTVMTTVKTDRTQYETQTVDDTETTSQSGKDSRVQGGTYDNTYGGSDIVERGGINSYITTNEGNKLITFTDTRTKNTVYYDYDKLLLALESHNVLDTFIDIFANLFAEVIYCE